MNLIQIDCDRYDIVARDIRERERVVFAAAADLVANLECPEGHVEVHDGDMVTIPCGLATCDYCTLALALKMHEDAVESRLVVLREVVGG